MTALERCCRLLLRAYPDRYRQDRGEEIIGTLLEATPAERSWPLARDVCALIIGGLRARAELNRRQTTIAHLRIAAVTGASAYLAFTAVSALAFGFAAVTGSRSPTVHAEWPQMLAAALVVLAVPMAWVTRRRSAVLTVLLAAAVAVSLEGPWPLISEVACLAGLALIAGRGERPGRNWLWAVALAAAWALASYLVPGLGALSYFAPFATLGILSLLWAVIDARPAVVAAVFLLALWVPMGIVNLTSGDFPAAVPLVIVTAVAPVAIWRLHRQSAGATTSRQS